MKILVITLNAWDETGSTGNTISNIFRNAKDIHLANIYCRDEIINNSLCYQYYQITESQIIKGLFKRQVGRFFVLKDLTLTQQVGFNPLSRGRLGNLLRRFRPSSLLFLREAIWLSPCWKNEKLRSFLRLFNPDVIYMHAHANIYMHRLMEYCARLTNAKIVLFFGDDMYGRKLYAPVGYLYESLYRKRLRKSIGMASLLFGGSVKLCDEYGQIFEKEFIPMFKECNLRNLKGKKYIGNPIRIIYAGNLLFGRENAIKNFIQRLQIVNNTTDGRKIQLVIYSNTQPNYNNLNLFNDGENTIFMGCRPYSEIENVMNNSDFTLFIESFSKKNIRKTRLSFSTKIIDCMQSDSAMIAVGPANIASMEYIRDNNLGLSAVSSEELSELLLSISRNPDVIFSSIERKTVFAKKYHVNTSYTYLKKIWNLI